jgi:hypothetical protein
MADCPTGERARIADSTQSREGSEAQSLRIPCGAISESCAFLANSFHLCFLCVLSVQVSWLRLAALRLGVFAPLRWIPYAESLPAGGFAKESGQARRWRDEDSFSGSTPPLHHSVTRTHRPLSSIPIKVNEGSNEG